jgi:peptidoglycan/LPS O-acetylase OafA/YrhL
LKYRAEIDGLRAVAILPVIFFHVGFSHFSGGFVGVDVFFVISGFLITRILIDELDAGRFSIVGFYERRARRILPALFVVAALCVPAAWKWLPPSEMKRFSDSLVSVAAFSSNILFWQQSGYFDTAAELKPLLHTWSLAVEEQYYIAFPAFLMIAYSIGKRVIAPTLIALFILSLCLAEVLVYQKPNAAFFLLPTRGWELLLGALCTLSQRNVNVVGMSSANVLSAIGLVMIGLAVFTFDRSTPTPSLYTLLPTLGAALVLLYARSGTAIGSILSSRPLVGMGLISYSVYLWHQPVLVFLRYAMPNPVDILAIWLAILATLCLGYLSWRYVETPFRNKRRISFKSIAVLGVAGYSLIGAIGLAGHMSEGFRDLRIENVAFARDAALQQVRTERQQLIRAGICHFDENLPIATFVAKWNCKSNDENLFDSRVVVFGDSHAADKTVALRLNGVDAWQITGAGCEVAPDFVKDDRRHCTELFHLFESQKPNLKGIILTNRFAVHELTDEYIEAILRYWGQTGLPVILFAPMPEFSLQQQEYAAKGAATIPPSYEREAKFFELIRRHVIPPNIVILKASDYWCANGSCAVARNGEYLMTDEDHLSHRGAEQFGKALLGDQRAKAFLGV